MSKVKLERVKGMLLELSKQERKVVMETIASLDGIKMQEDLEDKPDNDFLEMFHAIAKKFFKDSPPLGILKKSSPKKYSGCLKAVYHLDALAKRLHQGKNKIPKRLKQQLCLLFFNTMEEQFKKMNIPFLFGTVLNHSQNFSAYLDDLLPGYAENPPLLLSVLDRGNPRKSDKK